MSSTVAAVPYTSTSTESLVGIARALPAGDRRRRARAVRRDDRDDPTTRMAPEFDGAVQTATKLSTSDVVPERVSRSAPTRCGAVTTRRRAAVGRGRQPWHGCSTSCARASSFRRRQPVPGRDAAAAPARARRRLLVARQRSGELPSCAIATAAARVDDAGATGRSDRRFGSAARSEGPPCPDVDIVVLVLGDARSARRVVGTPPSPRSSPARSSRSATTCRRCRDRRRRERLATSLAASWSEAAAARAGVVAPGAVVERTTAVAPQLVRRDRRRASSTSRARPAWIRIAPRR